MLKHVSYRSSTSFNRNSDSCRNSVASKRHSFKHNDKSYVNSHLSLYDDGSDVFDGISLRNLDDTMSISSNMSFASMSRNSIPDSRYSSTLSLADGPTVPVKVYLRRLRPDMEYKTLPLSSATTCKQMITYLLKKFRLRHRDPNLFFVMMEVIVKGVNDAAPTKSVLVLDDYSRPAELQQCRPKGEARFSIGVRQGGLVRVHDSLLMPGSQYKSLLVSQRTTTTELVQLLLSCYNRTDNPNLYSIHEVCQNPFYDRPLSPSSFPLEVQGKWPKSDKSAWSFVLRRNIIYTLNLKAKLPWRRSLDQSSTDDSEIEDHNTTRASIMSTSSTSSGVSSSSLASVSSGCSDDCYISTPLSSPIKLPIFCDNLKITPVKSQSNQVVLFGPRHSTPKESFVKPPESIYINVEPSVVPDPSTGKESDTPKSEESSVTLSNENKLDLPVRRKSLPLIPTQPRPPKPVPRTLFLALRSRSRSLSREPNDSGYISGSHDCSSVTPDKPLVKVPPISYGVLSHSSPKKASVRSLSKSFANLSAICSKPELPHQKEEVHDKPLTKVSSKSTLNLSCTRNCRSCFYI